MKEENVSMKVPVPGPNSQRLGELRDKNVPRGVSSLSSAYVAKARGALIEDVDGNVFIDFAGGIGTINVGHCPPEVVEAIKGQVDNFLHTCFQVLPYEAYVRVAEQLNRLVPGNFPKKTLLLNSGVEAGENAVKIARRYSKKPGIISLDCSFHGRTYLGMSLTGKVKPYRYQFGPFVAETYKIPSPYCYRCPCHLEYPHCDIECLEFLHKLFLTQAEPEKIGAVIIEPVEGEGGFIVTPPEYLRRLRDICTENDILLIIDEIQTGFCRTGKFFAMEYSGVVPDLTTTAKSIAAGIPLSAVTGKAEIMDSAAPGEVGTTYGGNPVACAAALKVIELMESDDYAEKSRKIGEKVISKLQQLQEKHAFIGDVRGLGGMVAFELVKDRLTKEPDPAKASEIIAGCLKRGLLVLKAGIYDNVVRMLIPLVISDQQLDTGLSILEEVFNENA